MNEREIAELGRTVVRREAEALGRLAEQLDGRFARMVEHLAEILGGGGRLLFTGMGKSGLVARKIVSTLCSTQAPAMFLHPAEAAHGDLGLMTAQDVLVVLSRSGDLEVLGVVIEAAQRLGIEVHAWTSTAGSPLGALADREFVFDIGAEADPDDLIPSTSSTAALAFGDALAIALFQARGLNARDFARLHPAGNLGRRLTLRVRDLMASGDALPTVAEDTPLLDALHEISRQRLGSVIVVGEGGGLSGILTDGDVRRALEHDAGSLTRPVRDFMSPDPQTIAPDELAARAVRRMETPERRITALVVVNEGREPIGLLHLHSCLDAGLR